MEELKDRLELQNATVTITDYTVQIKPKKAEQLKRMLGKIPGFKLNHPDGAFYVFPDISWYFGKSDGETTIRNANDFCMYILNKVFVATVPGDAFGDPKCIRFSYATSKENMIEAVSRIKTALRELK